MLITKDSPLKTKIEMATLHIIGTEGIASLTNRRIAAAAGVSLGSITYHFATQVDLLRSTLLSFVTGETQRLTKLAQQFQFQHSAEPLTLEAAAEIIERIATELSFSTEQIASFELFIHAGRDPELREATTACFHAYDTLAGTVLEALGIPNAWTHAPIIVATFTGIQLRRLATGSINPNAATILLEVLKNISE
ncbi:MAG: TetR/AcrR family transcriptional regulator [Mycobacteriaceae bacterium]